MAQYAKLEKALIGIALVFAAVVACGHPAQAQSRSDLVPMTKPSRVPLLSAPDETAPPAAVVPQDEILSPVAQVIGTGGLKWYLVKTKSDVAGWIRADDPDTSKKLDAHFKSPAAEPVISFATEISLSDSTLLSPNSVVIPIQTNGASVIVPVVLNRSVQTNMILDTGASFTVVSQQLAGQLGLRATRRVSLVTANGIVGAPLAPLGSLKVGEAEAANLTVVIQDLPAAANLGGLLGLDFLSRYHVSIDSRRQLLVLAPR